LPSALPPISTSHSASLSRSGAVPAGRAALCVAAVFLPARFGKMCLAFDTAS